MKYLTNVYNAFFIQTLFKNHIRKRKLFICIHCFFVSQKEKYSKSETLKKRIFIIFTTVLIFRDALLRVSLSLKTTIFISLPSSKTCSRFSDCLFLPLLTIIRWNVIKARFQTIKESRLKLNIFKVKTKLVQLLKNVPQESDSLLMFCS